MASYTIYPGKFICKQCKAEVPTLRLYAETKTASWMCKDKHLTEVSFGKRKKKDYEKDE